jgi:ABC-type cobalamin transport system permease subunit
MTGLIDETLTLGGTVGGSGGTMTGLIDETLTLGGTVGGSGGTITGLIDETLTLGGTVGGNGGTMTGLATVKTVLITKKVIRMATRAFNAFKVMVVCLLAVKLRTKRVTQMGRNGYNKSNHFLNCQYTNRV